MRPWRSRLSWARPFQNAQPTAQSFPLRSLGRRWPPMALVAQTGWESFSPVVQTLLEAMLQGTKMCRRLRSVQSSALQTTIKKDHDASLRKNKTGSQVCYCHYSICFLQQDGRSNPDSQMSKLKLPRMITYRGVTDVRAKVTEAILD